MVPQATYPRCGYLVSRVSTLDPDPQEPVEGDVTVCSGCGTIMWFDGPGVPTVATEAQLAQIAGAQPALLLP